jgi:hypothetical protein
LDKQSFKLLAAQREKKGGVAAHPQGVELSRGKPDVAPYLDYCPSYSESADFGNFRDTNENSVANTAIVA